MFAENRKIMRKTLAAACAMLCAHAVSGAPTASELFDRAQGLFVPAIRQDLVLDGYAPDRVAGLTPPVVREGALRLAATNKSFSIAWLDGILETPGEQVAAVYPDQFTLIMKCRRSTPGNVNVQLWPMADGARLRRKPRPVKLNGGGEWKDIRIDYSRYQHNPVDGIELTFEVEGDLEGTFIDISSIAIEYTKGDFVLDFTVPEGDIWRAVLDVADTTELWINGAPVEDSSIVMPRPVRQVDTWRPWHWSASRPVDIAPFLRAGRNRMQLRSALFYAWARGAVIMASGERIALDTGPHWRWKSDPSASVLDQQPDIRQLTMVTNPPPRKVGDVMPRPYAAPLTEFDFGVRGAFGLRWAGSQPVYDGLIQLHNPDDPLLFYRAQREAAMRVDVPGGLAGRHPRLQWSLEQYVDGTNVPCKSGLVDAGRLSGNSLSFTVPMGRLARGAYMFSAELFAGETLLDSRPPEPLLVVGGALEMREVAGDTYEEGMNLELEDIIDFTDPDNPRHPWMEIDASAPWPPGKDYPENYVSLVTNAIVVERNGLKYREAYPGSSSRRGAGQFSYQVFFQHPGDWYLMVLEYPDDQERWMGVACSTAVFQRPGAVHDRHSKCGPAVWTGGKYPNTGELKELKWLYRPEPGGHAVNIITLGVKAPAAAARLRIYRVQGNLPALRVNAPPDGSRKWGMLSERTVLSSGFGASFGVHRRFETGTGARANGIPAMEACERLLIYLETCEAYAEYLRFTGQNLHLMGSFQYTDGNDCFTPFQGIATLGPDMRDIAARVFDANGIDFYASVEFIETTGLRKKAERAVAETGINPYVMVSETGINAGGGSGTGARESWNFMHPAVRGEMERVAGELSRKFAGLHAYRGVNWTAYFSGGWIPAWRNSNPDPFWLSYDDFTMERFASETGIKVPGAGSGNERFRERSQFLAKPAMRPIWTEWRVAKLSEFFAGVAAALARHRGDLECVAGCYQGWEDIRACLHDDIPFAGYYRDGGWDKESFRDYPAVRLMPWLPATASYQPAFDTEIYAAAWQENVEPEFYAAFNLGAKRSLMLNYGWIELERIAGLYPDRPDWPRPFQYTMQAQQSGAFCREPYAQAMIGMDPEFIAFGFTDAAALVGQEDAWRLFARVFRALPADEFKPWGGTGFRDNFAIRELRKDGRLYFYAANPGYWPIAGHVTVRGARKVTELSSGEPLPASRLSGETSIIPVHLPPFGIQAFVVEGDAAELGGWGNDPVDEKYLRHMRAIAQRADMVWTQTLPRRLLPQAEQDRIRKITAGAMAALDQGKYATAWSDLTHWKFWSFLSDDLARVDDFDPWVALAPAAGTAGADGLVSYPAWTADSAGWRVAPRGNYAVYCDLDAEGGRVPLFAAVEVRGPKRCRARLMFGSACPRKAWMNRKVIQPGAGAGADKGVEVVLVGGWSRIVATIDDASALADSGFLTVVVAGGDDAAGLPQRLPQMDLSGPKPVYRVNCGAEPGVLYTDHDGNLWLPDHDYAGWGTAQTGYGHLGGEVSRRLRMDNLRNYERWGMDGYRFHVPAGSYQVRLHFAETYAPGIGRRVFEVSVQDQQRMALDIFAEAGMQEALVKTFDGIQVAGGVLRIDFKGISGPTAQVISGIEVIKK